MSQNDTKVVGQMAGRRDEMTGDQFRASKWGVRGLAFSAGNCMNCTPYTLVPSYFVLEY